MCIYIYTYGYFVCMYECAHVCLVTKETRRCHLLELELEMVVSSYMNAGNKTWVLWKSKKHSTVSHLSSQDRSIFQTSYREHPSPVSEIEIKNHGIIF